MQDFIRNVAELDLYAIAHMTPDALRETLCEYREAAIVITDLASLNGGTWGEHALYKPEAWRNAVADGDTRLGYWGWVATQIAQAQD